MFFHLFFSEGSSGSLNQTLPYLTTSFGFLYILIVTHLGNFVNVVVVLYKYKCLNFNFLGLDTENLSVDKCEVFEIIVLDIVIKHDHTR